MMLRHHHNHHHHHHHHHHSHFKSSTSCLGFPEGRRGAGAGAVFGTLLCAGGVEMVFWDDVRWTVAGAEDRFIIPWWDFDWKWASQ